MSSGQKRNRSPSPSQGTGLALSNSGLLRQPCTAARALSAGGEESLSSAPPSSLSAPGESAFLHRLLGGGGKCGFCNCNGADRLCNGNNALEGEPA